jgi:hypothetical protein
LKEKKKQYLLLTLKIKQISFEQKYGYKKKIKGYEGI